MNRDDRLHQMVTDELKWEPRIDAAHIGRIPQIRAADVQAGIREALARNADLDVSRITVTVRGDKVILGGEVGSWIEREIAERTAWSAPGVTAMAVAAIENHIDIARPGAAVITSCDT
jgi:hypothetical protein